VNLETINLVLVGALTISSWVVGLFFLRFFRTSRDRLFVFFALAFLLLGCNWLGLAIVDWSEETRHWIFVLRLLAFVLVLVGAIDKNRRASSRAAGAKAREPRPGAGAA